MNAIFIHDGEVLKSVTFDLPLFPPPLSACFKNARRNGRVDTERYKLWKIETDSALWRCKGLTGRIKAVTIPGDVKVAWTFAKPDKRRRDLDNLTKAANDLLTRLFIIEDDASIIDLRLTWGATNTVTVERA